MNSGMVDVTMYSPNHSGKRTHAIDRITPHCVVGQASVEALGKVFQPTSRQASSNYGIGVDGRIGLYVDECNRSWCSSSNANDQRAVTIECASDTKPPYAFNDTVFQKLVELCTDICLRNEKEKLVWIDNKTNALNYEQPNNEMLLTVHRWFADTACPGDWLMERMGELASLVTENLSTKVPTEEPTETQTEVTEEKENETYNVQLGTKTSLPKAFQLLLKAKVHNLPVNFIADKGLYSIMVGKEVDYRQAVEMSKSLKGKGFKPLILPIRKDGLK